MKKRLFLMSSLVLLILACKGEEDMYVWKSKTVTVSAYNSVVRQTDNEPSVAAWGDTLIPGMKSAAISQDLLKLGLEQGTKLKIKGLDGVYVVNDKMNSRWKNKIDIYMGKDIERAKEWGVKEIEILYRVKREEKVTKDEK